ncbi:MAG: RICIN domain-containing protein [Mucilaginibacter sp.]
MKKNVLRVLTLCLAVFLLQNCSKNNYKPEAVQQPGAIANSSGLKLNEVGSTGFYQFIAFDGKAGSVSNNSTAPGNSFNFTVFNGSPFQKWQITQVSANLFSIRNVGSNLYLQSYNYTGKQVLVQGPYTGTAAQQWYLQLTGLKAYKVVNKADGLAITASSNGLSQLQPFANLSSQMWGYNQLSTTAAARIRERTTLVYFGTVDEGPRLPGDGQMAKLSNPANYSQWEYVRTHADGYVQSFITMDGNNSRNTPLANLQAMAAAFTNKGCYYAASTETTVQASGHPVNDAVDRSYIDLLTNAGFNVNSAGINYGTTPARTATLRTYKGNRPCLQLWGPWDFGGDINSNHGINARIRSYILATDGISFDGPMGLWYGNYKNMREGAYSATKFAHDNGKLASMDPAPSGFFGDPNYAPASSNFFGTAKSCVMGFEDHDAALDEWDLYLYQEQGTAIFPEVNIKNGTNVPANSQTGFGYWLIRHLNTLPKMAIPNTGIVSNNTMVSLPDNSHAQIIMNAATSYSMQLNFSNKPDTAIELSPLITAAVAGNTANWQVTFKIGTTDVTNAILGGGLNCVNTIRLTSKFTLPLIMTVKALNASASPVTINFITAANISHTANKLNYSVVAQTQ